MEYIHKCDYSTFDSSNKSIVLVTMNQIDPTIEQVDQQFDLHEKVFSTYENKFVAIFDCSNVRWVGSKARIQLGKRSARAEELFKDKLMKVILVLPNPILVTLMKGINLVYKPQIPQNFCKNLSQAYDIANKEIDTF